MIAKQIRQRQTSDSNISPSLLFPPPVSVENIGAVEEKTRDSEESSGQRTAIGEVSLEAAINQRSVFQAYLLMSSEICPRAMYLVWRSGYKIREIKSADAVEKSWGCYENMRQNFQLPGIKIIK